jgi:hypothetical protein
MDISMDIHCRVQIESHFFPVYYFSSKQEACQEVLCELEVNEIMPGCHPSYLKTVSLNSYSKTEPTPFDFRLPTPQFWFWNHTDSHQFWLVKMAG